MVCALFTLEAEASGDWDFRGVCKLTAPSNLLSSSTSVDGSSILVQPPSDKCLVSSAFVSALTSKIKKWKKLVMASYRPLSPFNNANYYGIFTARKRSFGQGNVFTPVCHSVHVGGDLLNPPPQVGQTLLMQTLPRVGQTPRGLADPSGVGPTPPQMQTPRVRQTPRMQTPIWSTSGRYTSYWNAYLFQDQFCGLQAGLST